MAYGNSQEFYNRNPDKYEKRKQQIHERRERIRQQVKEYRKSFVCSRCGFDDYRCIDFHHRDSANKIVNISLIYLKGWSWERIQSEIDKCDPVCKNCHAILHA